MKRLATPTLLLLASLWLLVLAGCTKKEDVAPTPTPLENTYTLDGTVIDVGAGTSRLLSSNGYDNNGNVVDRLLVTMRAGTQTMPTTLYLTFNKPLGADPSQYKLEGITYLQFIGATVLVQRDYNTAVRYELKHSGYDHFGTFEAKSDPSAGYPTSSSITAGAFKVTF